MDKISCLMSGADDYITKPFSISELIARVDAVCRRVNRSGSKPEEASQIVSGPFTLNLKSRTVFKNGEQIDLTQVEYQIMEYFFKIRILHLTVQVYSITYGARAITATIR